MMAIVKTQGLEGYDYQKISVPEPVDDEVQIKVSKVALCGSDINLYKWNETAKVIASLPFTPGHEATGIVTRLGPNTSKLRVGDRVAVENHFYCGDCYQCYTKRGDICSKMSQYGHGKGTVHGGCSEYSIVPEKYCYKLQHDSTTDTEAVLLEPMGVAHNAVERLKVKSEDVLVIGCGPVGLFAIACAKAMGAEKVYAVDVLQGRLDLAVKMGADKTINPLNQKVDEEVFKLTEGSGIGRICEASGNVDMLNGCFKYLRKGGRVSILGLPKKPLHIENVLQDIVFKSLTITTVHGRRIFHTWNECERLIHEKKVNPSLLVTHDISMKDYKNAFQTLVSGDCCKVLIDPSDP